VTSPARLLRDAYPEALSRVTRKVRDLALAEDALHSAVVRALETWPDRGVPHSPVAWLVTAASNRAIDSHRSAARAKAHVPDLLSAQSAVTLPQLTEGWRDDALRLVVTCCNPALGIDEAAALTLATIGGLSTVDIAGIFLVQPRTMEQRLVRARRRLAERATPDTPAPEETQTRLPAVLAVIHALHAEGAWSNTSEPIRDELCRFALQLARALVHQLPEEPEALGLLAILEFHQGRLPARQVNGAYIPLDKQERSRWDSVALARGRGALDVALSLRRPGPFQIEAAISAIHCTAESAQDTDWPQIALLYEALERHRPAPSVTVNRAFALGMASGPAAGLAVLESVAEDANLARGPYVHLVRGVLLVKAGRRDEATAALDMARVRARNPEEERQILARIEAVMEG